MTNEHRVNRNYLAIVIPSSPHFSCITDSSFITISLSTPDALISTLD